MIDFDRESLEALKNLCRLDLSSSEETEILSQIPKVLEYVQQLDELDTKNTTPCRYVLRGMLRNNMREDVCEQEMTQEAFFSNAPDEQDQMIRIPFTPTWDL